MRNAALLFVVCLVACAGSADPRTQYLLRAEPVERAGRVQAPVRVGLARVLVAPYLDQSGIVVETEAGQVQAARQHQWAEPLDAGLRSLLRAELSKALGYDVSARPSERAHWDFSVDVFVDQLHGTMAGTALIDAGFRIAPRTGQAVEFRFSRTAPLPIEGYPGLVDAEVELVRQLARAIAEGVRGMSAAPAAP